MNFTTQQHREISNYMILNEQYRQSIKEYKEKKKLKEQQALESRLTGICLICKERFDPSIRYLSQYLIGDTDFCPQCFHFRIMGEEDDIGFLTEPV